MLFVLDRINDFFLNSLIINNIDYNTENKNIISQNIKSANNNDIFSQMQPNPTEANAMKECFKNEDISLYYTIIKKEGSNIDGAVFATNHS